MIINHNLNAMNAHRQMSANTVNSGKSMEKLSSGLRINRAGDDAAGLAISEKMRGQIRGLDQASRNSQDGISMIQTAEGGLNETHAILQRMRELAVQASNDTNVTKDRDAIQGEMNQLTAEISRIGNTTEFNTQKILNGGSVSVKGNSKNVTLQIGANEGQTFQVSITDMRSLQLALSTVTSGAKAGASTTLGTAGTVSYVSAGTIKGSTDVTKSAGEYALNIGSAKAAGAAASVINTAINTVSKERAKLGAYQNRLEHTIANLNTSSENLSASESRVRDVDMAKEMMGFSKNNILTQAAQAMLAQANQAPQGVLQLLR
ncbi:flagellin N-terminal helical domain-containing protein [Clostridium brassicae]|uniref:Flagellin n=1 Tax=Clostridium brassicae TaxID=2999072 RepID=A0ABT4DEV4_9CLOT|nr:flagellin [Clostridium brassicae]MCY6959554.1 flagellin [Clostridium brassicae]